MPGSAAAKLPEVDATAISSAVAALEPYMVETLTEFVATESLLGNERSAAEFMEKALSELGLQSERIYLNTDSLKISLCIPRHAAPMVAGTTCLRRIGRKAIPAARCCSMGIWMWCRPGRMSYGKRIHLKAKFKMAGYTGAALET